MRRKITFEEWTFRRTGMGYGGHCKLQTRHLPNEYIHRTISTWEHAKARSTYSNLFRDGYERCIRERRIRKLEKVYTISKKTYNTHPRGKKGKVTCPYI